MASSHETSCHTVVVHAKPQPHSSRRRRRGAKTIYFGETQGAKLLEQLGRIARDPVLLSALARGDAAAAQAEADAQIYGALNHTAHVTRIAVLRSSRVLVNATINANGVFVCTPGLRVLRLHGRPLGTLLVSIQDVVGFVKLIHRLVHVQALGMQRRSRWGYPVEQPQPPDPPPAAAAPARPPAAMPAPAPTRNAACEASHTSFATIPPANGKMLTPPATSAGTMLDHGLHPVSALLMSAVITCKSRTPSPTGTQTSGPNRHDTPTPIPSATAPHGNSPLGSPSFNGLSPA
jgi:hypothetical protein